MGKIIAFSNQKGGVGKTTTTVNLASYVALKGKTVLVIDLDPQGNASSSFGIDKDTVETTVYDLLMGDVSIDAVINETNQDNLHLIPSNTDLAGAELKMVSMNNREYLLKNALSNVIDVYDYIFIDCPPSLGLLTVNALTACKAVLIPIQSEFFALEGLSQLMNTIKLVKQRLNPDIEINGVALTMFDSRSIMSKQVKEELVKFFGKKMYSVNIPRNVKLCEAPSFGTTIYRHAPHSSGAMAYDELSKQFIEREGK